MQNYKILLRYSTGDSRHYENATDILEMSWTNLDVAKANLKRIEEHYRYSKKLKNYKDIFEISNKDWFVDKDFISINLYTDYGSPWTISAFWSGYFDNLQEAEIILDAADMKICF